VSIRVKEKINDEKNSVGKVKVRVNRSSFILYIPCGYKWVNVN
jgi:hypothetical protein